MTVESKLLTADELLKMKGIGRCELIQGELIMMSPAGAAHGVVAMRIGAFLTAHVVAHQLGVTFGAETGFRFESDPDTVRAPDASFVRQERIKGKITPKFFNGVPDLAVEVISPDDTRRGVIDKANMWLANGTQVVWIADPPKMTIAIRRVGVSAELLNLGNSLQNEPLLPGFVMPIDPIFKLL